ncbi:MAG: dipeptide/oligopeptide/nickel ABC transporter permease/ATP-binding protein [Acidimicrobiales bacterium]
MNNPPLVLRLARSVSGGLSLTWIAIVLFVAAFGRFIAPMDSDATNARNVLAGPSWDHFLGTDSAGRDVFSRLLVSTQNSILAVLLSVIVAVVIGVAAGLIAGYFGGWFDQISSWLVNLVMAMPGIVVLLAARSVLGSSVFVAMGIFGVLIAPSFFRLVQTTVRSVRNELFVDAARVAGISDGRIIARHVLRVVRGPIVIQTAIVSSIAIAVLAGLAILGFGDINSPSWGSLLSDGFSKMFRQPWLLLWPSLVIALTSLALATLGNALRDALEGGVRNVGSSKVKTLEADGVIELRDGEAPTIVHTDERPLEPLLTVNDLVVGYPDGAGGWTRVVRGVDLEVGKGEVLGLVGESGSGKSQTAFAILGLLSVGGRVLGGSVVFDEADLLGDEVAQATARGRRISYVPQEPMSNLDPSFTIGSQLVEPMRVCLGMSKADARARALELLDRVGIPEPQRVFDSYPHQVSGGMAQRVLIAGAVAGEPDLIIADEPTTALDVTVQAEILDLLRDLQADLGTSILLVTHNFGVVADLADRVAVMQEGRIIEQGPVRKIFREAQHPYTQSLLDAILDSESVRAEYVRAAMENQEAVSR